MTPPPGPVSGAGHLTSDLDAPGKAVPRVDGLQKVTGGALYSADHPVASMAYAVAFSSTIASGSVRSIDTSAASKVPGVLLVLTHDNAEQLQPLPAGFTGGRLGQSFLVLQNAVIQYGGQYLGVVIAQTLEAAAHAAMLVDISYAAAPAATQRAALLSAERQPAQAMITTGSPLDRKPDSLKGDPDKALQAADVKIVETYTTPIENHNPMEPSAVIAVWEPPGLTVYTSTQWVIGARGVFAQMFGVKPSNVHVISRFVGGGFGCKGSVWPHELLAVMAAKAVGRPVKLVMTRAQMFAQVGHRPPTEQRISLGATRDGTLTSVIHEVTSATSMSDSHAEPAAGRTPMLYACPNIRTSHQVVKAHVNTPTSMRAPGSAPGSCAFEAAIDELAFALGMDPIELRLRNYANTDDGGKPFTSKALRECYQQGAASFGWRNRSLTPGAIRDGNFLVGQGMATAVYPTNVSTASASVRLHADGTAVVESCTHDLGTGAATIMAQVASGVLGLPVAKVAVQLGDSSLPTAPVAGGSRTTASVCPAVDAAARDALSRLSAIAVSDPGSPLAGLKLDSIIATDGKLVSRSDPTKAEPFSSILQRHASEVVTGTATVTPPAELANFSAHAFGAQFAEVRVDIDLRIVRVTRFVGAFGVGRVLNPITTRSQLMGGMIWGIGMALLEQTIHDEASGAIITASLADYLLPVNADVPEITVLLVDEQDAHVNTLGVKGLGELGITGAGAAVANAVHHATGRRVRDMPISIEKLL